MLFEVLLAGEHALHGFTNRDVRQKLRLTAYPLAPNEDMHPGQVTRLFRRLHAHGLIAKIQALSSLASLPPWPQNHGHCHQTQGSRLPQSLRNRRLICGNIFTKHKEDTRERFTLLTSVLVGITQE